jgi:hypothetical protein
MRKEAHLLVLSSVSAVAWIAAVPPRCGGS